MTAEQFAGVLGVLAPAGVVLLQIVLAHFYSSRLPGPDKAALRWSWWTRVPNSLAALGLGFMFIAAMQALVESNLAAGLLRLILLFAIFLLLLFAFDIETMARPRSKRDALKLVVAAIFAFVGALIPAAMLLRFV